MRVLLGVTGGIAAFKAAALVRRLREDALVEIVRHERPLEAAYGFSRAPCSSE